MVEHRQKSLDISEQEFLSPQSKVLEVSQPALLRAGESGLQMGELGMFDRMVTRGYLHELQKRACCLWRNVSTGQGLGGSESIKSSWSRMSFSQTNFPCSTCHCMGRPRMLFLY